MDTLLRDPYREAIEAGFGRPVRELAAAGLPSVWPAFEAGEIDEPTYWQAYRDAGHDVDPDAFHVARRAGYRWLDGVPALLDDVAHHRLLLATNYPDWVDEVVDRFLDGRFDAVVASHAVGARKPDAAFYAALVETAGVAASHIVFVDDREANVAAAAALGLDAIRFTDAPSLRVELARRELLDARP